MKPEKRAPEYEDSPEFPNNEFAERLILGAIAKSGDPETYSQVAEVLNRESFTLENYRRIFSAMDELYLSGDGISATTVALKLQKNGQLQGVSVSAIVDILLSDMPNIVNLDTYVSAVAEAAILRKLCLLAEDIKLQAIGRKSSVDIVRQIQGSVMGVEDGRKSKHATTPETIIAAAGGWNAFLNQSRSSNVILTPWDRINRYTRGMKPGQHWILGGLPGTGKTTFARALTRDAILGQKKRVLWATREMTSEEMLFLMACESAGVSPDEFSDNNVSPSEKDRVQDSLGTLVEHNDFLDLDEEISTPVAIASKLRSGEYKGRPFDLLIVDHLGLIGDIGRFNSKREETDSKAYALKGIAKKFRIPVLSLSQLGYRKLEEKDQDGFKGKAPGDNVLAKGVRPPSMGDFREAGGVEQSADVAIILQNVDVTQSYRDTHLVDAFIVKQRRGKNGKIPFKFHANKGWFEEIIYPTQEAVA